MTQEKKYLSIVKHYEECFDKYGDTHLGVDWPKPEDVITRYQVMLDLLKYDTKKPKKSSLLDFGCGLAHFYDFIVEKTRKIDYSGLDISKKFISQCRNKHPHNSFYCLDIFNSSNKIPIFDYIIMNGVFTEKRELSTSEMTAYLEKMITIVFNKCKCGMAFNVMSKLVDWERSDLFHMPFDQLSNLISKQLSRNFVIRHDYGLYEYTVYIYKKPNLP
jgi:SAM-dependent methyltransferase